VLVRGRELCSGKGWVHYALCSESQRATGKRSSLAGCGERGAGRRYTAGCT